jgi:hypothetical protein
MAQTKVRVSYGVVLNCGNFESVRLESGIERDLAPGENYQTAFADLYKQVRTMVDRAGNKARERMMG